MDVHVDLDNWLPSAMVQEKGNSRIWRSKRATPKPVHFFFTTKTGKVCNNGLYDTVTLAKPITFEGPTGPTPVHIVNYVAPELTTESTIYNQFDTKPRSDFVRPPTPKAKTPWSIPISVFAKYKFDNDQLLDKCFEFDWS